MSVTSLGYSLEPPEWPTHASKCMLHEDRTGFVCVECKEEIEKDAEKCDACEVERYDRSVPDTVYDNGPIFERGDCICLIFWEDDKYKNYHYY